MSRRGYLGEGTHKVPRAGTTRTDKKSFRRTYTTSGEKLQLEFVFEGLDTTILGFWAEWHA